MQDDKGITGMLMFSIFSAVLGMFQFGYNTGVINAPQKILEEFIANIYKTRTGSWITEELRDFIWSLTVSVFAIGGMIGGISGGMVANWCGRKTGLVLNNSLAVLGVTLMSSSHLIQSIECLILGRFFIGINCGINTALVPMYLTEISTLNLRGALGTVSQLGVTIGLLLSQVLGLKQILGTKEGWPFLFGVAFIPALLQLLMLPFCPESPRYLLISRGRVRDARQALKRLRNCSDIEDDMEEMRAEERAQQSEAKISMLELIKSKLLRAPLIIGIVMQLSQQLSGINAIFYYSTDIFLSAEVPEDYAVYSTIGVGVVMVLMTLVSILLMDRLGRRTLHLHGLAGMFLASIFLTISLLVKFLYEWMKYISVISVLFYVLFFAVGPGSIPWMITSELFSQGPRPAAMSIAVLVNWSTNFAVGLAFPIMKRALQSYLFLPFTAFLAIFWTFTYHKVPETKNRTFEEVAALFKPVQLVTLPAVNYGSAPLDGSMAPATANNFNLITNNVIPPAGVVMNSGHLVKAGEIQPHEMVATSPYLLNNAEMHSNNGNIIMAAAPRCMGHHHDHQLSSVNNYNNTIDSSSSAIGHRPSNGQFSPNQCHILTHSSTDNSTAAIVPSGGIVNPMANNYNTNTHVLTCRISQHPVNTSRHFFYQDNSQLNSPVMSDNFTKPRSHAQLNHVHPIHDDTTIVTTHHDNDKSRYNCDNYSHAHKTDHLISTSTRPSCNNTTTFISRHAPMTATAVVLADADDGRLQDRSRTLKNNESTSPRFVNTACLYQSSGNLHSASNSYYVTTAQSDISIV